MNSTLLHNSCPACSATAIQKILAVKDFTVSGEIFDIYECGQCSLRFTQAIPTEDQIGKYYQAENYISHTNSSKGLINRLYLMARKFTLKAKRKIVSNAVHGKNGNLLDLGAGTGAFAAYMNQNGWDVTALEPDPSAREKGFELNKITLQPVEALFQLPAESFQAITMWHVLEHVHRLHEYLGQLKKLLAKEGVLFIAVPNYTSYDAKHYQEYWAAYDVPRHLYHFSPTSMRLLLNKHGFTVKKTIPMWLDSFYVSMLSEKYKTGKASLLKGIWYGSLSNTNAGFKKERCSSLIYVVTTHNSKL